MHNFYKRFCKEGFDHNGVLNYFEPVIPEGFNFGYDVIDAMAGINPEHPAMLWCNEQGEEHRFSFGDISRLSNQMANLLDSLGLQKGDMVLLMLGRHHRFWPAIYALHKLGLVAIPATHQLTKKDLLYRFEAADVRAVFCAGQGELPGFVEEAEAEYGKPLVKLMVGPARPGWADVEALLPCQPESLQRRATAVTDPMLMYFTSGTTGYPKMVLHDYSYPIGHIVTAKYWHNLGPDSLHITVADTGWAKAGWGKIYGQWMTGATQFVYDYNKFVPTDLLRLIEKYRITSFCAPPTVYRFFIKEGMKDYDLASLQYATTAGEALNAEVFNRFLEYTGVKLMEGFGQSESALLTGNLAGSRPRPGSMGKPSPLYTLELVDEDGQPVEPGAVGEIVVHAPENTPVCGLFREYYKDAARTREVWHDGLYHTGDTAWCDEDGYFWYVGRTDDVIKASGYRIGPFEIESVLMEHPAVLECAVTGAPDPVRGTVVKASIVLTKGYTGSPELVKELQSYVKKQTAPYKYPRIIEFLPELPKTISGKIRRVELRGAQQ